MRRTPRKRPGRASRALDDRGGLEVTTVTLRRARPDEASMLSDLALAARDSGLRPGIHRVVPGGAHLRSRRHRATTLRGRRPGRLGGRLLQRRRRSAGRRAGQHVDQAEQDRHRPRPGPVAGRDGHAWPTGCVRLMRSSDIARPIRCWSPLPRGAHRGCPRVTDKTFGKLVSGADVRRAGLHERPEGGSDHGASMTVELRATDDRRGQSGGQSSSRHQTGREWTGWTCPLT